MKAKHNHRWIMLGAILGMTLFRLGVLATTPEQSTGEDDPVISAFLTDEEKLELGALRQKAITNELTPEEEKRDAWLGEQFMQWLYNTSLGRFALEGVVVDQQGIPLEGVSLRISKEKVLGGEHWQEDKEERIINGNFSVTARGYDVVRFYVNKEGYFEERLYFPAPDPDDWQNPQEPVVNKRDIRIILEKKGNITKLIGKDYKLAYRRQDDGTASGRVVDFDRNKWEEYARGRGARNPIKIANLLDPEAIPSMCVYMLPKVNEDGRILTETKELEKWKPYNHTETYPKELRIVTNDPEGGFIIYDRQPDKNAYWTMKLAPDTGYSQEIVLDADHLFQRSGYVASGAEKHIFFYCKLNGLYGKGRFESIRLPEGDYALEMKTEFRMQVDGSRNLDTGRK